MGLSFLCRYAGIKLEGGAMHGRKWMSVGNDRMVEMFSLHSIYSYVLSS